MNRKASYLASAGVLVFLAAITLAQESKQAAPIKEPSYKIVTVKSDKWSYRGGDPEVLILTGNVTITQGDTTLTADRIEYNRSEDVQTASAAGNVRIADPEIEITGEKGSAFFNEKRVVIEGSVKALFKPKEQSEDKEKKTARSRFKDSATMTCERIEYLYKKKEATAAGGLTIVQKDRTLTAAKAFYKVKDEELSLSGGVKVWDSKGQSFSCPSLKASLKEGAEWMEMEHAVGTFRVKSEEEEKSPAQ